jgi:hypothetical protein
MPNSSCEGLFDSGGDSRRITGNTEVWMIGNRNCQFGWLRGWQKLLRGKDFLVAGACNHPNLLVIPFRAELIRCAP